MQQEAEILTELGAPVFEATDAQPGSAEKIAILEQRARLGQPLWHPGDNDRVVLSPADLIPSRYPPVDYQQVREAAMFELMARLVPLHSQR